MEADAPAKPHPGLVAARTPSARGPADDPQSARRAYLDLLKLAICDLVGWGSTSVGRTQAGGTFSREVDGDALAIRAAGMDWPLHGLTMVGLRRLDDLQECVEAVVAEDVKGDLIEAGTWRGGASILMRATLDSLGASERATYLADSFAGFAPDERRAEAGPGELDDLSAFDFLTAPVSSVQRAFERLGLLHDNVRFVEGQVEETLPGLGDRTWAIIRIDLDTHDSTLFALEALYPRLAPGGFLIVDDYGALEECRMAVDAFRAQQGISAPLEEIDWTGVRWRRERSQ